MTGRGGPRTALRPALLVAAVLTGVGAGLGGIALTLLLHGVEHLAFGYDDGSFLVGVERASPLRRVLGITVGGVVTGTAWWLQRTYGGGEVSVPRTLAEAGRRIPVVAAVVDAVIQIAAVGAGASLGREGAPRLVGAAGGSWLAAELRLDERQRRALIASGAGAGLAAVYNVPLSGAAFTLEILLGSLAFADLVPALVASAVGTVVAWPVLGTQATYAVRPVGVSWALLVAALLLGPAAGAVGWGFRELTRRAQAREPQRWRVAVAVPVVLAGLGALAVPYPQLLGNGKGAAASAFAAGLTLPTLLALVALKPLVTAACVRAGARGGLLTPSLATGAVLGGAVGLGWSHLWAGTSVTACALVGAAAVLATTQRAPVTAVVLTVEFTHARLDLLAPMAIAVVLALATSHRLPGSGRRASGES